MIAACSLALAAGAAWGIDITSPIDPIFGSSENYPGGESVFNVIDNTAQTKYLNFDELNTGFTVTPSGFGTVTHLTIITANDAPERDPTTYILEGSDNGVDFTIIASGALNTPTDRFAITSASFANSATYAVYRVTFPTIRNSGSANSMQVAEVQLATAIDVTTSADTVSITLPKGAFTDPAQGVDKLLDNKLGTKLDVQMANLGPTIVDITPVAGATIVSGISYFSGNDDSFFLGRTPSSIELQGSNDGVVYDTLTTILPQQASFNYQDQEFEFGNSTSYTQYRLVIGTPLFDTDMQIGDIELFGTVPNPMAPANDQCSSATVITGTTAINGTTALATGTDITDCGDGDSADVWFRYTAPANGRVEAGTCGNDLDTTLAVFNSCSGGAAVACDDNGCFLQSVVQWDVAAGQTYFIRLAGVDTTGFYRLQFNESVVEHSDTPVELTYNFNGMTHIGEEGQPDSPTGYRSISDRGLSIDNQADSLGVGTIRGTTGVIYDIVRDAGELDVVHLGDRNTTDNGGHAFDIEANGDEIGIQPDWLPSTDQTGPQSSDVSAANIELTADSRIGVLYQISNNGGAFEMVLFFDDASFATVTLQGPDWFFDQVPAAPQIGVETQVQLGVFAGTQDVDFGNPGALLNVVEAIVSRQSLMDAGYPDFTGKHLSSITFQNRSNAVAGYAVLAASVRDAAPSPPVCRAAFNGDMFVNSQDFFAFIVAFFAPAPNADFNNDDFVNSQDFFDFIVAFFAGC